MPAAKSIFLLQLVLGLCRVPAFASVPTSSPGSRGWIESECANVPSPLCTASASFGLVFILPGIVGPNLPAGFRPRFRRLCRIFATGVLAMLAAYHGKDTGRSSGSFVRRIQRRGAVSDLIVDYYHAIRVGPSRAGRAVWAPPTAIPIIYVPMLMDHARRRILFLARPRLIEKAASINPYQKRNMRSG